MKIVRRRVLRGEMLCRRLVVEVAALACDFDEAHGGFALGHKNNTVLIVGN